MLLGAPQRPWGVSSPHVVSFVAFGFTRTSPFLLSPLTAVAAAAVAVAAVVVVAAARAEDMRPQQRVIVAAAAAATVVLLLLHPGAEAFSVGGPSPSLLASPAAAQVSSQGPLRGAPLSAAAVVGTPGALRPTAAVAAAAIAAVDAAAETPEEVGQLEACALKSLAVSRLSSGVSLCVCLGYAFFVSPFSLCVSLCLSHMKLSLSLSPNISLICS